MKLKKTNNISKKKWTFRKNSKFQKNKIFEKNSKFQKKMKFLKKFKIGNGFYKISKMTQGDKIPKQITENSKI